MPVRDYTKIGQADVEVQIARNQESAAKEDEMVREEWRVYSDGSAVEGGVGGAAVLMRGNVVEKERRFHLGTIMEHTVYAGEIVGMILAVQLLRKVGGGGTIALGVDNQAAIKAAAAFSLSHSQDTT